MADPFAAALRTLHGSPIGARAVYTAAAGAPTPILVVRTQGSDAEGNVLLDRDVVSIQAVDVATPARGDTVQLLGQVRVATQLLTNPTFRISADPLLDIEGMSWSCAIALA